jgi:hypothetical protein
MFLSTGGGAAPHLPAGILSPYERGEESWCGAGDPLSLSFTGGG